MDWVHHQLVHGALTGLVAAAAVDYRAFLAWRDVHDALTYSWSTALWRWFQGAVSGLVAAAGLWAAGV